MAHGSLMPNKCPIDTPISSCIPDTTTEGLPLPSSGYTINTVSYYVGVGWAETDGNSVGTAEIVGTDDRVGLSEGDSVVEIVGASVCPPGVGCWVRVGIADGMVDGIVEGCCEGSCDGMDEGDIEIVGACVGVAVGETGSLGDSVGVIVGVVVGAIVGVVVGVITGGIVGGSTIFSFPFPLYMEPLPLYMTPLPLYIPIHFMIPLLTDMDCPLLAGLWPVHFVGFGFGAE